MNERFRSKGPLTGLPADHAPAARTSRRPGRRTGLRSLVRARTLAVAGLAGVLVLAGCTDDGEDEKAKDAEGKVIAVHGQYQADSKSGTPGSDNYKVKGNIHWVSAKHAYAAEVRLYDRLFAVEAPGEGGVDFIADLNPNSKVVVTAQLEAALKDASAEDRFQFERHGYFVADRIDSRPGVPVFNRAVTLKDSWTKGK